MQLTAQVQQCLEPSGRDSATWELGHSQSICVKWASEPTQHSHQYDPYFHEHFSRQLAPPVLTLPKKENCHTGPHKDIQSRYKVPDVRQPLQPESESLRLLSYCTGHRFLHTRPGLHTIHSHGHGKAMQEAILPPSGSKFTASQGKTYNTVRMYKAPFLGSRTSVKTLGNGGKRTSLDQIL